MSKKRVKKETDKTIEKLCLDIQSGSIVSGNLAETVKALALLVEARALLK